MPRSRSAFVLALLLAIVTAARAEAGLFFERVPAPQGADVNALAGDGARLWAATPRGVWRYEAGLWALDGLGDRTIASVAVSTDGVFAADGANVLRRLADGSWIAEALPSALPFPSVLVASGGTVYAGGLGVFRRSGGTWTALPSPGGGFVSSAALAEDGTLVVGLTSGGAARFSGASWTPMTAGLGAGEVVNALTSFGGLLHAGTDRALYSQFGTSWVRDASFGTHDVRALTGAEGALRAATADAGVFRKSGGSWIAESAAFVTRVTKSFGTLGSDLFVGTAGGPVYRLSSGSFGSASAGLDASTVSDVRVFDGGGLVTTRGAGALLVADSGFALAVPVPAGCGDLLGAAQIPGGFGTVRIVLASDPCGAIVDGAANAAGLPAGARLTSIADGGFAGTVGHGAQIFTGSSWTAINAGLSDGATVATVRAIGAGVFAGVGPSVATRSGSVWDDVSAGLPTTGSVLSLGGAGATVYAGLGGGGVYRRDGASIFRKDAAGVATATVFSLDVTSAGLAAALGTGGLAVKRDGGWTKETMGLPAGADVRVARGYQTATAPARHGVFAGTAGSGLFFAATDPIARTIPVVLDVVGGTGARFRTELTIGNRGASAATVHLAFVPAPGFGAPAVPAGSMTTVLAPGAELRAADALDLFRAAGVAIPAATPSAPIAGTLSLTADAGGLSGAGTETVYAIARTYTRDANGGSYGLFYDAVSDVDAAEEEGFVYGLRSVANVSRSNLAMAHLPGRSVEPITLAVQVYSASGAAAGAPMEVTLQPGEWRQLNGVLGLAGLPEGSFGWVRIARTAGIGPWTAYGVVNDAKTSDGSYLPLFRPGGVTAARRLLVPVVLDVFGAQGSRFTTELTLVNDGPIATPVDLFYQPAPGAGSAPGLPYVTVSLGARQQLTIPDAIQYLRENGIHVPDASTGAQVGTLEVSFRFLGSLDSPRTVALARTSTPSPTGGSNGTFGLFYPAIAVGGGARDSAVVPALAEDASVRSNLALVHAGGGSGFPLTLRVQLFDAATGAAVGSPLTATLAPFDWVQFSRVLEVAGALPATTRAYAVVTRLSGDDSFFAYGVLNDNVTSDGSYLPMIVSSR